MPVRRSVEGWGGEGLVEFGGPLLGRAFGCHHQLERGAILVVAAERFAAEPAGEDARLVSRVAGKQFGRTPWLPRSRTGISVASRFPPPAYRGQGSLVGPSSARFALLSGYRSQASWSLRWAPARTSHEVQSPNTTRTLWARSTFQSRAQNRRKRNSITRSRYCIT